MPDYTMTISFVSALSQNDAEKYLLRLMSILCPPERDSGIHFTKQLIFEDIRKACMWLNSGC